MFEQSIQIVFRMLKLTVPAIFIVQYMRSAGWLKFMDRYAFAIVRFTGFEQTIGHAFFASLGSAHAGSGMLIDLYKKKKLTLAGIVLASVYISLASHVRLIITFTIPAAFSLLPMRVAFAYSGFMLFNGIAKSISAGLLSHFLTIEKKPLGSVASSSAKDKKNEETEQPPWKSALDVTWKIARRAVLFAFISSLIINWLDQKGVFQALPLNPEAFGLPAETLKILAAWFAHVYAGMGMVGQMASNGELGQLQVFQICLFCAIASRPVFFLKEAPGYYFGLFGPKIGLCLFAYHMGVLLMNGSLVLWLVNVFQ